MTKAVVREVVADLADMMVEFWSYLEEHQSETSTNTTAIEAFEWEVFDYLQDKLDTGLIEDDEVQYIKERARKRAEWLMNSDQINRNLVRHNIESRCRELAEYALSGISASEMDGVLNMIDREYTRGIQAGVLVEEDRIKYTNELFNIVEGDVE